MKRPNARRLLESLRNARQQVQAQCQQVIQAAAQEPVNENLHKWFKEKWVRFGPDGKIRGDCARGSDSEGKPKCLPQSKAHALGKKGRASAAAKKRRQDPNPERRGAAINVATKKKTSESKLDEKCWDTHRQAGMKRKGDRMVPNCVPRESQEQCPECGGEMYPDTMILEKQDACYYKVKSRYKVWPSAYASGALVQCRKKGAKNWGKKTEGVAEGMSWSALDEGLSVEDKIIIFEEYMTKGNLTESLEHDKRDYFISLFKMSSTPAKDKTYIVVPLSLVGNKIMQLDAPAIMKFVGHGHDGLVFDSPNGEKTYPSKIMRDLSVFNTFTFRSQSLYDKFRTALSLKFNVSLPLVGQGKHGVAEGSNDWSGPLYDPALQGNGKKQRYEMMFKNGQVKRFSAMNDNEARKIAAGHGAKSVIRMKGNVPGDKIKEQGVAEGLKEKEYIVIASMDDNDYELEFRAKTPEGALMQAKKWQKQNHIREVYFTVKEKGVAEGLDAEAYKEHLIKTLPQMMKFLSKNVKGWRPSEEQMLSAIDTAYMVMKHTGDVKQAGKALQDELNTLHRMSQGQPGVAEGSDNLDYIGNCTEDDVVEHIFGDATNFAQAVDEHGDEFTIDDLVVKYDPESDVHSFYYKKQGVAEGAPELLKQEMPLVRHIEQELAQHGYEKGTPEYDQMYKHTMSMYRKFGNVDAIKRGVAEGLNEFAPDDSGGSRKFIPWNEFIESVKAIVGKDFSTTEKVIKSTIQARFIPHDPMEYGPTMLYSYYEARAGRNKGAMSTRGSIQVGKYYPNNTGLGKQNFITSFNLLKGHPFERHFDLTFDNVYKIANIIMGNTEGAYQMQPQGVAESFDQPYPMSWEKGDFGDVDALAKLDDGTYLHVMFNLADRSANDWGVAFYRGDSQSVTGQGDAQRVFATVLAAIGRFVKKQKPDRLFFTAVKEEDPTGSRAKLYDRLVQKYATGLGYELQKVDYPQQTGYKLTRKEQKTSQANKTKQPAVAEDQLAEKWSQKYKKSINCNNPRGFSQRAHCAGRKKNEAANPAQQAAIAIAMKKAGKKPKSQGVREADDDDAVASNAALISGPGTTDVASPKPTATPMAAPTATATSTPTGSADIMALQNKLIAAGEKIKADGIMGPRTQAALTRYNAAPAPVATAQPKPAVSTPAPAAPATAVQSGSGAPIRTGSGGYVVSPDTAPAADTTPAASSYDHNLMLAAIKNRESGGDPNAVSRVGAVGTMQTMPNTLKNPGYGVKPARDNSPQELERVGKDYYNAMLKTYKDPKVALAAYNWGPGNVNKWMNKGGDFAKLPRETRAYVKNIMGDYQAAQAAQATKMAAGTRPAVSETRGKDQDQFGGMHQDDFQALMQRLKQLVQRGPLKTVRDPETGRTRNVPVSSLPNKSTPK